MFKRQGPVKNLKKAQGVEDLRRLCAKIITMEHPAPPVILVSSCHRGEGASTVALNLAKTFVQEAANEVLLVDANLRQPALHDTFDCERGPGLVDMLEGTAEINQVLRKDDTDCLSFITAGKELAYPGVVLNSDAMGPCIQQMRNRFRIVIMDSPPIIPYSDSLYLAKKANIVLLVLEAERTRWEVAEEAVQKLAYVDVDVYGTVLNRKEFYIPNLIYRAL